MFGMEAHRKQTHTQQYMLWESNHQKLFSWVIKDLIHRPYVLCDLKKDLLEELFL